MSRSYCFSLKATETAELRVAFVSHVNAPGAKSAALLLASQRTLSAGNTWKMFAFLPTFATAFLCDIALNKAF